MEKTQYKYTKIPKGHAILTAYWADADGLVKWHAYMTEGDEIDPELLALWWKEVAGKAGFKVEQFEEKEEVEE